MFFAGKNPPPVCMRLPRLRFVKFCVEFSNVYFANRNVHLCIDAEANWEDFTLLQWSFDCIRMGVAGFHVINAEDGGGIPERPIDTVDQTDEDYDDSARDNSRKPKLSDAKIIFHRNLKKIQARTVGHDSISVRKNLDGNFVVRSLG